MLAGNTSTLGGWENRGLIRLLPLVCGLLVLQGWLAPSGMAHSADSAGETQFRSPPDRGEPIGTGDGRIHLIPSLSAPSVKNGERLSIQAVVKAQAGVARVEARIERETPPTLDLSLRGMLGLPVAALELRPGNMTLGGVNADGTLGLWQADWTAHGLEEAWYRVTLTVTDHSGHRFSDQTLRFSDPIAGRDTVGSNSYSNGGLQRREGVSLLQSPGGLTCAIINSTSGYAYFGTVGSPAKVVKVALGNGTSGFRCVAVLTLNSGESSLLSAVINTATNYGYFGTSTTPGRVVKVALGSGEAAPTRVGAVTLNTGENYLTSAVVDATNGYAYFGTHTSPGRVVKVTLGSGAAAPTRVGSVTLNTGENSLISAVRSGSYAYFGTGTSPGRVVKVALGTGNTAPTRIGAVTLRSNEEMLECAVVDAANGYAYFGTGSLPALVVKVALGSGNALPTRVGAATLIEDNLADQDFLTCATIASGYAYFGTQEGRVVKVALGSGSAAPTRVNSVHIGFHMLCAVSADGNAYFGTASDSTRVVKVALGSGTSVPSLVGDLYLSGERDLSHALIDPVRGYAYLATSTSPGQVVKMTLGSGIATPSRVGAASLDYGEDMPISAVIDTADGYAYFGTATSPGRVVKVALGSGAAAPTRVSAVTLNSGENSLHSAVIDAANGYAYFGTGTSPGRVVKVALGSGDAAPTRFGAVTLDSGENSLISAVIDAASGYAWFGTNTAPGRVVKVALGSGAATPTRVGAVTLDTGENNLRSAVIDAANGYAYFGTSTTPGRVVRVALSQKDYVKGTKLTLPELAGVQDLCWYAHVASGNVRLALYNITSTPTLLWESDPVAVSTANAWLTVPISSGTPSALTLPAGDYWLAWQVDTMADVPSYAQGSAGAGFYVPHSFGAFPPALEAGTATEPVLTDEVWSGYLNYDNIEPRVTLSSTTGSHTRQPIPITAEFSEAVFNFRAGDVRVTNGLVLSFSGSGSTYQFIVLPITQGQVTVQVPAGACTDAAGDPNSASNELGFLYDGTTTGDGEEGKRPYLSTPNTAIPDAPSAGTSDDIVIAEDFVVRNLNVYLNIAHSFVGDLRVSLEHIESGISVLLVDRPGRPQAGSHGCSNRDLNLVLDDEGTGGSVHDQCQASDYYATSPPNYVPMQALSAFDGLLIAGTWRLSVSDHAGGDIGTLVTWCLFFDETKWAPRAGHTTAVFDNKLWVMGGTDTWGGRVYCDVWWSEDGAGWTKATEFADWGWGYRREPAAAVHDGKLWILGGIVNGSFCNDVWWSIDGVSWTQATAHADWPARRGHTAVALDNKLWVMGGGLHKCPDQDFNDVWWSADGVTWTEATPNSGWQPRQQHTSVVFDNRLWVLGGNFGCYSPLNDVHWSPDGMSWTLAALAAWPPRLGHTSVSFAGKLWIIGGWSNRLKNDIWWSVNGAGWTQATANAPWSARERHTSVMFKNMLWVLGGHDGKARDDVWWSTDGVNWVLASHAPPPDEQDEVWVDFNHTGPGQGTQAAPYSTLAQGVAAVQPGGAVNILSGATSEMPRLSKAMRLSAVNGPVRIGVPVGSASQILMDDDSGRAVADAVKTLTLEEIARLLAENFAEVDLDADGILSEEEIRAFLLSLGIAFTEIDIQALLARSRGFLSGGAIGSNPALPTVPAVPWTDERQVDDVSTPGVGCDSFFNGPVRSLFDLFKSFWPLLLLGLLGAWGRIHGQ